MFTQAHIAQANAIESQIEMELMFLSEATQLSCLELIMGLEAEARITYLNQYMNKVTVLVGTASAVELAESVYLMAA